MVRKSAAGQSYSYLYREKSMSKVADTILFALLITTLLFSLTRDEPRHNSRHTPEIETVFAVYFNGREY